MFYRKTIKKLRSDLNMTKIMLNATIREVERMKCTIENHSWIPEIMQFIINNKLMKIQGGKIAWKPDSSVHLERFLFEYWKKSGKMGNFTDKKRDKISKMS